MRLAFGYCGWKPADFWSSTWYELQCAIEGTQKYGLITAVSTMFGGKKGGAKNWRSAQMSYQEAMQLKRDAEEFDAFLQSSGAVVKLNEAARLLRRKKRHG